jgi:hypothetical protein
LLFVVAGGLAAVAVVLGILAIRRSIKRSQDERFFHEIMLMQEALDQYANQSGRGEPSYTILRQSDLKTEPMATPIDGTWHIKHSNKGKNRSCTEIIVEHPDRTLREMEALDAAIDDGNLATGNFRIIAPDTYSLKVLDSDPDAAKLGGTGGASK